MELTPEQQEINRLYVAYDLSSEDIFKHRNYTIIKRAGIEKIQAQEQIEVSYEVIECTPEYCAVKAKTKHGGKHFETFGSAVKGPSMKDGNTISWYVLELAEKRAMGRLILRTIGWYKYNHFSEDESEEFKDKKA